MGRKKGAVWIEYRGLSESKKIKGLEEVEMREVLETDKRVTIYGSKKEIEKAKGILNILGSNLSRMDEGEARLLIQDLIDNAKVKASILFDGNTVWSFNRVIRDFKQTLNSKPCKMTEYGNGDYSLTNYLYEFLSLVCGSIAHFNKYG